jgi:hypothetical protein
MEPEKKYIIELTQDQLAVIEKALMLLPMGEALQTYGHVVNQAQAQKKEPEK